MGGREEYLSLIDGGAVAERIGQLGPEAIGRLLIKRGFLIGSRRSRGGVCGPSPIWLKLGRVTRGNLKSCQETIFLRFVACRVI